LTNYWIFKAKDEAGGLYGRKGIEIFDHRIKELFWSIRECTEKGKKETKLDALEKGDYVVFYLVGKYGSSFIGSCVLDSAYLTLDEEQAKKIVHREYIDYNKGVFIKEIHKWAKHLPVESLRTAESLHNYANLGAYFQGSIKKMKSSNDYTALIALHKQIR
jgi:hypothetical protein